MTKEEAIEVYNGLINKKIKEAFEFFAPELKESEDERIIKTLQEYVKNRNWMLNGPTQAEVLAWLEKQKEPNLTEKIASAMGISSEVCNVEQKPAEWSEEDEKTLQSLLRDYEYAIQSSGSVWGKDFEKKHAWLKSLRPQKHWKSSEINPEEVRLLDTTISFLKDFADKGYENAVECIDWLKSKRNGTACK